MVGSMKINNSDSGATLCKSSIKIFLPDGDEMEFLIDKIRIEELLDQLAINPVEVIVAKNGIIVSEDEIASLDDELKIIRIVHGG